VLCGGNGAPTQRRESGRESRKQRGSNLSTWISGELAVLAEEMLMPPNRVLRVLNGAVGLSNSINSQDHCTARFSTAGMDWQPDSICNPKHPDGDEVGILAIAPKGSRNAPAAIKPIRTHLQYVGVCKRNDPILREHTSAGVSRVNSKLIN